MLFKATSTYNQATLVMDSTFYYNELQATQCREAMEAVDVQGFGKRWRVASGMTAEEAIVTIAYEISVDAKAFCMEAVDDEGASVMLPRASTLRSGFSYTLKRIKAQSGMDRRFGAGGSVVPSLYYYVPPDVDALVEDLKQGKYCILCGSRQSGKSTSVMAAKERLSIESDACIVYLGGLISAKASWDGSKLWGYFWDILHAACPDLFRARIPEEICSEVQFMSLFDKDKLLNSVTVVLDEADTLLNLSPSCIDEFLHVIRLMKYARDKYNLYGFLLVGTEALHDLIEAQYDKRALGSGRDYQPGSTPSKLSPFPHDHVLSSTKFSLEDVQSLLNQAAADRPDAHIDVDAIAGSIMQWTWGHKGLTGTCLAYLVQEKLWTFKNWINWAESYRLGTYIFGQATYNRIMQYVKRHADNHEVYNMLVKLLQEGEFQCEHQTVVKLRDFIAQGVLVATEEENGDYVVCLSSPLLRTAILRGCAIIGEEVDPPPNAARLDRKWVLLQAIRSLDVDTLCKPECLNARGEPMEYGHQFLFMCRIKAIIRQAYPSVIARVLPEAKEIAVPGRRRSQLRLDTLVRDGDNFSKFGFELVANGSRRAIIEHIERAVRYHELHTAQVFVINFCLDKAREQLVNPCHDSVIFVSVYFNVRVNSAVVTFVDMHGTTEPVELPLKMWNGNISFKDL